MAQWTPAQDVPGLQTTPPPVPPLGTEKEWFYSPDGQERKGPVAESELKRLLAAGQLPSSTLVWSEGLASWVPAASLAALQPGGVATVTGAMPGAASRPLVSGPFFSRTHNRDLMTAAREALGGQWGVAICPGLICFGISMVAQFLSLIPFVACLASIGSLLIEGPLMLGLALFFLVLARVQQPNVGMMFNGFNQFGNALAAYILTVLFTLLWMLLLIIPGIIAAYRYAMTFYILADHPGMDALAAIRRSKEMMRGNKLKLFCLGWRFFWWFLLCIPTCFIGLIWLVPYMNTRLAKFYDDLKPAA